MKNRQRRKRTWLTAVGLAAVLAVFVSVPAVMPAAASDGQYAQEASETEMMQIPVIGLVENFSYFVCPDCGKKHHIFGESRIEDVAAKNGTQLLARLPFNPEVAALCDKGIIELMENDFLDKAAEAIENKFVQK